MASSSSTISTRPCKYDVFLSFRGTDTRNSFTCHLYDALCRNHIDAYIDDKLWGGEKIEPALLERIEESYISVVVFSPNYADSTFCLRELSKILECKETKGQMVIPVFYRVDPSHVQELIGSFGDALTKHERNCSSEEVESWRHALKEIANLKGWESNVTKLETILIDEIVSDILKKSEQLMLLSSLNGLVGIDSRVEEVESLLHLGSLNVHIVGIVGMGGIGTLNTLPTNLTRNLQRKKILIVLDNVSTSQQLKALVGEDGLFGEGSRIIVTSRDRQVLRNIKAEIYEVEHLVYHKALQLFRSHAFQENHPPREYSKLSEWVASYAKGIPLVLKVLGSNLFGKGIEVWKSEKEKLERSGALNMEIQKCFRTSFDGLDQTQKNIFLDIACFFKTCDKDRVQELFKLSEFHPTTGISSLSDKCLISVSGNTIGMHDLLQQLGQDIVCEVKIPKNRSRLWVPKDIVHVLTHPQGSETVEAISLDMSGIKQMMLSPTVFREMYNLRLLEFCNTKSEEIKIHLPGGLEFLPDKLVSLCWDQYPLKSLPSNFCAENLVELRITHSQLEQVWDEFPALEHLKIMDLSNSGTLIRIPDFSKVPNLEDLNLSGCRNLKVIPPSIDEYCCKLATLNLNNCENLCSFPSCLHLTSLNVLDLSGCPNIAEFPKLHCNIKKLYLDETAIEEIPSSIGDLSELVSFSMDWCKNLKRLPDNFGELKFLKYLSFFGCSKLAYLPNSICDLKSLEYLNLLHCPKVLILPGNLRSLKSLRWLFWEPRQSFKFDVERKWSGMFKFAEMLRDRMFI